MDFDDFEYEFETTLDQEIDSVRSEYPAMFGFVEKRMPLKLPEIGKLLNVYNQVINKSIEIVEKFRKEILQMWDYGFDEYVKHRMEEDPDLEKDDVSEAGYWDDMEFLTNDYFENTADQDLVKSVQDAKQWEWRDEYEFGRKFKEYIENLHSINNDLVNSFQE